MANAKLQIIDFVIENAAENIISVEGIQQFQTTNAGVIDLDPTNFEEFTTISPNEDSENEGSSKKYFYAGNPLVWHEAVEACLGRNMTLLSIEDEIEQQYLSRLLINTFVKASNAVYLFWTSGYIETIWAATDEKFNYTNWRDGYPKHRDNNEYCIVMTNHLDDPEIFLWASNHCGLTFPYICQYKNEATVDVSVQNDREFILTEKSFATRKAKYYVEEHERVTWAEAIKACKKKNVKLLTIADEAEQRKLEDLLYESLNRASYYFWTAGHIRESDKADQFIWEASEQPLTYTNWHDEESIKDEENQNCLEINNDYDEEIPYKAFQWFARNCEEKRLFICEK